MLENTEAAFLVAAKILILWSLLAGTFLVPTGRCCCFPVSKASPTPCDLTDCSTPGPSVLQEICSNSCPLTLMLSNQLTPFFVVVQSLSHVQLFATLWTVTHQASLTFAISQSLIKLMSIESVMPSSHLALCCPLLPLTSVFLNIRVFSSESALHIR